MKIEQRSARSIAKELFISPSALTRFSQKMGYEGFNDFRRAFCDECSYLHFHFQEIDPNYPFKRGDSAMDIAAKMSTVYQETVMDTCSLLQYETLERAARILHNARVIYVASSGTSGELAVLFQEKMARIHKTVVVQSYVDMVFNNASISQKDEAFILMSYSGETNQMIKLAKKLKERNVSFIAITSYGQNTLSKYTDTVLNVSTREHLNNCIGPFGMNISSMYLLDTLYACVFRYDYDKNLKEKYEMARGFQNERNSDNPILRDETDAGNK